MECFFGERYHSIDGVKTHGNGSAFYDVETN
jgi:hypothetical protein